MRTASFERVQAVLADDDWHSEEELSAVVRYPELWVRQLATEDVVEVSYDADQVRVRRRLQPAAA